MIDLFDLLTLFSTPELPEIREALPPSQSIASPHCNTHGRQEACTQTLSKNQAAETVLAEPLLPTAQYRRKRCHDHPLQQ